MTVRELPAVVVTIQKRSGGGEKGKEELLAEMLGKLDVDTVEKGKNTHNTLLDKYELIQTHNTMLYYHEIMKECYMLQVISINSNSFYLLYIFTFN